MLVPCALLWSYPGSPTSHIYPLVAAAFLLTPSSLKPATDEKAKLVSRLLPNPQIHTEWLLPVNNASLVQETLRT